jgi:hypothetical protein
MVDVLRIDQQLLGLRMLCLWLVAFVIRARSCTDYFVRHLVCPVAEAHSSRCLVGCTFDRQEARVRQVYLPHQQWRSPPDQLGGTVSVASCCICRCAKVVVVLVC